MKIAFINSGLEPGHNGVGDYTRMLAQECLRQGHVCCLIALNDHHIFEPKAAVPLVNNDSLRELRLPSSLSWPHRIALAQTFLNEFAPDWISLQFVPYGFHPKGLVFNLAQHLHPLMMGRYVHIMFHELWLGEAIDASIKYRMIGALQKQFVLHMVNVIKPRVVHTSNCGYVSVLHQNNVRSTRLPMFGSIPVLACNANSWLFTALTTKGFRITASERDRFWLFGFFGGLHPGCPPEPLFRTIFDTSSKQKRQVALLSVGRMGRGENLWKSLEKQYSSKFMFLSLGPQSVERVSQYFNSLDAGIASSPYSLIGKSSSVAAMLDHGLPIIVNRDDEKFRIPQKQNMDDEPLLHLLSQHGERTLNTIPSRSTPCSRLPQITRQFLNDLSEHMGELGR